MLGFQLAQTCVRSFIPSSPIQPLVKQVHCILVSGQVVPPEKTFLLKYLSMPELSLPLLSFFFFF